jgi:hypothetical protein
MSFHDGIFRQSAPSPERNDRTTTRKLSFAHSRQPYCLGRCLHGTAFSFMLMTGSRTPAISAFADHDASLFRRVDSSKLVASGALILQFSTRSGVRSLTAETQGWDSRSSLKQNGFAWKID